MIAIGGCHVSGYLVGEENSFIRVFLDRTGKECREKIPHFQLKNIFRLREKLNRHQPDVVLLQLGNHEFHASLKRLLLPRKKKKKNPAVSQKSAGESATSSTIVMPLRQKPQASLAFRYLLTPFVWGLLVKKNRKHLEELKMIIQENPGTRFLVLSPIPCFTASDNFIRYKAGQWYKKLFGQLENAEIIDLFAALPPKKQLYIDGAHLNQLGHRLLGRILVKKYRELTGTAETELMQYA